MNAIISNGDYTALVQLPVDRKQLAGALSYLGKNHASAYDIQYNEESDKGLSFTLDCRGVVENAIANASRTMSARSTSNPLKPLNELRWKASASTFTRRIGGSMENNLQRDIDFAIHLAMLKMLLESGAISEEEHRLAVSKLREKTNCKLIVTSANF